MPSYGPKTALSQEIFQMKYCGPGDTFESRMRALASIVPEKEAEVAEMLLDQEFLAGGRINNSIRSAKETTAINCFHADGPHDSMEGIFKTLTQTALTSKMGGGVGLNFSRLRHRNAMIKTVGAGSSGAVSFMHIFNEMGDVIKSAGDRRMALMISLRCDHPDLREFITAKTTAGKLTNANISVQITDKFMNAVEHDLPWELVDAGGNVVSTESATELWDLIMRTTIDYADPGVMFIDQINARNNLWYCEEIIGSNPCGEVPLPAHGACLLGSMNLVKFIYEESSGKWVFDYDKLRQRVGLAVRFLNAVIDVSDYPLPEQQAEMKSKRRIGLGITGLANALERMGYVYGDEKFVAELEQIMMTIRDSAYLASIAQAKEDGPFPLFDAEKFLMGEYAQTLPEAIRTLIATYGVRNSHLLSIAPTGTISLCADNVSSGIEPVFTHQYNRTIITPNGQVEEPVKDYAFAEWGIKGKTALEITPQAHLVVQAACQKYVDQAISKTINLGKHVTFEQVKDIYRQAYLSGCKGTTIFHMGGKKAGLFIVADEEGAEPFEDGAACTLDPETGKRSCD